MTNTAQLCRLGLFQDTEFAGDLEDSKSTSGGILCIFGSRTFIPTSWMCKKQTSVSRSSTESEVISLDVGFRMDGLLALDLWDVVIEVLHSSQNIQQSPRNRGEEVNHQPPRHRVTVRREKPSHFEAQLYIFEDNEAVIKMTIEGRSPTVRHMSQTHRVALDWLFDRINLDPKIQIKHVDTKKKQLADMLTKGNFTRDEWNYLLRLFNVMSFSMFCCSHFSPSDNFEILSKRQMLERKPGEERMDGKIEASEFGIEKNERKSFSHAGFGHLIQPRSHKHRENGRDLNKNAASSSQVASK